MPAAVSLALNGSRLFRIFRRHFCIFKHLYALQVFEYCSYAGPGSQKVTQGFSITWGTSLVTSHDVIYASIDGRGSGRQSDELLFQIYRRMGSVEIEDQIAAAK